MKRVADILTASRFVFAPIIAWMGMIRDDVEGLRTLVLLTLGAWTTDTLDGILARRSGKPHTSWIGSRDLEADLSISIALGIMLIYRGVVLPVVISAMLLVGWMLWRLLAVGGKLKLLFSAIWPNHEIERPNLVVVRLAIGTIDGGFAYVIWRDVPGMLVGVLIWFAANVLITPRASWFRFREFLLAAGRMLLPSRGRNPDVEE